MMLTGTEHRGAIAVTAIVYCGQVEGKRLDTVRS